MKNRSLLLIAALLTAAATAAAAAAGAAERHPLASRAEGAFFEALNTASANRPGALSLLTAAYASDPNDARTTLWLGLTHLWSAAEGDRKDPSAIEHLMLAERYLARAAALNPADDRIASWLIPTRLSVAAIERDSSGAQKAVQNLRDAYARRPVFHSFSIGLLGRGKPTDSPEFREGLAAVRAALDGRCVDDTKDVSCGNKPHWPHNVEAFLLFGAEYEARSGNLPRSAQLLAQARASHDYATWPYRSEAEELSALVDSASRNAAGMTALEARPSSYSQAKRISCLICHGTN